MREPRFSSLTSERKRTTSRSTPKRTALRKSFLKRGEPPKRSTKPIRKVNPARKRKEFARCYGSKARVEFVKSLRCLCRTTMCESVIENAHIKSGGTGRKADADQIVPLCRFHHGMLHNQGINWFENTYGLFLEGEAFKVEQAWQAHYKEKA